MSRLDCSGLGKKIATSIAGLVFVASLSGAVGGRDARGDGGAPSGASTPTTRVAFLAERLRSDDFRVRTNAAISLGQTNEDTAVGPLCASLNEDANEVTRGAVAVALKRLARPSSLGCLKSRLAVERDGDVKAAIQKAIEAVDVPAGLPPPSLVPHAKYYVAMTISNGTNRSQTEVERILGGAVRGKFDELGRYQLAPTKEPPDAAKAQIAKRSLKGYHLAFKVDKFDYSTGDLKVSLRAVVSTYPGMAIQGEIPMNARLPGARAADHSSEDEMMKMLAEGLVDKFASNFQ